MIKIAVGGQLYKAQICDYIKKYGGDAFSATAASDFQAAMDVKNGKADYYFGCCETGAGGSLAGAIAFLGYQNCASVSFPGIPPKREKIAEYLKEGKKAFGFTNGNAEEAVKLLCEEILKLNQDK
jgi:hypothetical protein